LRQLLSTFEVNKRLKLSSIIEWDLGQLLKLAKQANWLPSEIAAHPLLAYLIQTAFQTQFSRIAFENYETLSIHAASLKQIIQQFERDQELP